MKPRTWMWTAVVYLFAALAAPVWTSAQDNLSPKHKHHQYKLIDIGTPGGPVSYFSAQGLGSLILNERGTVAGYGDTPYPDPYDPSRYLTHAFRFLNGILTDLGTLPGGDDSAISGLNARGWVVGGSRNGMTDPLLNGPAGHAVLWTDRETVDLGTLGGYESFASYVNDGGQVVGFLPSTTSPTLTRSSVRRFTLLSGKTA